VALIVGGLDIHRKQVTFDYADLVSGEVRPGQIAPADRAHLRAWLSGRFGPGDEVRFAVEACTGWRYVAEELAAAGVEVLLAEPADTSVLRGPKRHAKTDKTDSRLLRVHAAAGDLPLCWIPPRHVLECRALLECYHDLRAGHTAWVQRVHAALFHQGAPAFPDLGRAGARAEVQASARAHLSPAGQLQVAVSLRMLDAAGAELDLVRAQILAAARQLRGARELAGRIYGVGPVTALALACWLGGGRFTSARKAVRFAGLDITVHSTGGRRSPGHLSRQGPPVLRWALYEAAKTSARASAPDHAYYAAVAERIDGKRAALSQARKITRQACHILAELGDDALTMT